MSAPAPPADLLDLKFLPAWVKEPSGRNDYSNFTGEEGDRSPRPDRRPPDRARRSERKKRNAEFRRPVHIHRDSEKAPATPLPAIGVRFVPHTASLENVTVQIRSGSLTYSVFALARLFLEKPERYNVRLLTPADRPLYQLGEEGPVSTDRRLLENSAFSSAKDDFYQIEVAQTDPIKGNFSNVARCRASGTLLGPTNHHSYQTQLRNLYEQRFSRRMSFADYQRQIELVNDPAAVEQWKEQARNVTTYTTRRTESPLTFNHTAEAERHFRQHYLPDLIRHAPELTINGVLSRRLPDRALARVIEDAWAHEMHSPSSMMQELAAAFRQAGLNIFRHRRGMLFVSPIRLRLFKHDPTAVSASIGRILEAVSGTPGMHRKELAEKVIPTESEKGDTERFKLSLAADLRWLISEGYLIEFNDGSLDLPRVKPASPNAEKHSGAEQPNESKPETQKLAAAAGSPAKPTSGA